MGLAATIAGRSLLQRPGRTLFSVLGIAVGIATVVCIFTLDHNTIVARGRSSDPEWRAEIEVSPSASVQDPRAELERVPGVKEVTAAFQSEVLLVPSGGDERSAERVSLVGLEPETAPRLGAYHLLEGRSMEPAAIRAEALIGEGLARRAGIGPGDAILLARPQRAQAPERECVDGEWRNVGNGGADGRRRPLEFHEFLVTGVLAREGIGRKASGDVVVVDYRLGMRMFEGQRIETRYWLKHDRAVDVERLQANLGRAWSYDLQKSVIIGQAADERAFRNGVRFAGLLAMVLGLFVIFHTLSMSLIERVREVGVLHALGATRAQIGRVFLGEAVIIAGLGGALGLGGGLLLARAMLRVGITTVGVGEHIRLFQVPWHLIAPLAAAGVGIALLGSIYPLARARGTDAVSALRGEDPARARGVGRSFRLFSAFLLALVLPAVYFRLVPVVGEAAPELVGVLMLGLGTLALFVAVPLIAPALLAWVCVRLARPLEALWPLAGKLAARSMAQGPTRVAAAVSALALVTAGFVGLRGMTRSLEAEIRVWGEEAYLDKVYARNLPRMGFDELAQRLERYPGVLGVEPNEARIYAPFLMVGLREDQLADYGPCKERPELIEALRERRGVILSKRLAGHRGYRVGDSVHVTSAGGSVESFPVVAISDAYGYFPHPDERLYGVVSDRHLRKLFCIDTDSSATIAVRFDPRVPRHEAATLVRTALAEIFPGQDPSLETGEYLYHWHTSDIARDFILFDIILFLTAFLAAVGVLNGQLLAALERAKELGVLKALGTSRRQVAGMVLLESAVVGVLGGGLGAALGAALAPVIVRALHVISGLPLPQAGPGAFLLWGWAGAVGLAFLAGLYPIWRMSRTDATAAVRTG
jgi:putative ABC transport system permease protein